MDQAMVLDSKYPGGLEAYVSKAKKLLKDAADEVNPFEGYTPRLADGESLTFGAEELDDMEAKGLEAVAKTAFVLVAGGLGERLGYDGIKLALPVEAKRQLTKAQNDEKRDFQYHREALLRGHQDNKASRKDVDWLKARAARALDSARHADSVVLGERHQLLQAMKARDEALSHAARHFEAAERERAITVFAARQRDFYAAQMRDLGTLLQVVEALDTEGGVGLFIRDRPQVVGQRALLPRGAFVARLGKRRSAPSQQPPQQQQQKFVGCTSRGYTGGRSHRISHPPSFCASRHSFAKVSVVNRSLARAYESLDQSLRSSSSNMTSNTDAPTQHTETRGDRRTLSGAAEHPQRRSLFLPVRPVAHIEAGQAMLVLLMAMGEKTGMIDASSGFPLPAKREPGDNEVRGAKGPRR